MKSKVRWIDPKLSPNSLSKLVVEYLRIKDKLKWWVLFAISSLWVRVEPNRALELEEVVVLLGIFATVSCSDTV